MSLVEVLQPEKCPFKFGPDCLKACIRYEGCELESKVVPKLQVAKKPEKHRCPGGKSYDCKHIMVDGTCNRRSYANRKPDWPCTSYLRKVKQ